MSNSSNGKKLVINSIVYSLSGLLMKCFSFFLIPLYTAYLSTEEYGITSIATSFLTTMGYIVSFSLFSAVMRFYVDLKDDKVKLKRFYGTVVAFVVLSGITFGILFVLFGNILSKYVFAGIDFYPVVFICVITMVFSCLHTVFDQILKSQQRAGESSILSIAYFLLTVTMNIVFVVVFKKGAMGVVLSTFLSSIAYTLYFVVKMLIKKEMSFCFDLKLLKEALKYSIPIMPHNLSTQIAELVSKSLIGGVDALSVLGIYSIAAQFGNLSDTIQNYVNQAYAPWLYENLHNKADGYKDNLRGMVNMLVSVIGLMLIGIALFAHDYIILFVDEAYVDSWKYVPLIVLVFALKVPYYFYVNILFYYKKASRVLFVATLSSSLLNIALSAFLIPAYGAIGSIIADAICMLLRVTIIIVISKRFDDIGLRLKDFILNFFVTATFIFVGLALSFFKYNNTFSIWNFIYKVFVVLAYILYVLILNRKRLRPFINLIAGKIKRKKHI